MKNIGWDTDSMARFKSGSSTFQNVPRQNTEHQIASDVLQVGEWMSVCVNETGPEVHYTGAVSIKDMSVKLNTALPL